MTGYYVVRSRASCFWICIKDGVTSTVNHKYVLIVILINVLFYLV